MKVVWAPFVAKNAMFSTLCVFFEVFRNPTCWRESYRACLATVGGVLSSVSESISTYIDHKSRYEGRLGAFCSEKRNVFYLTRFFEVFRNPTCWRESYRACLATVGGVLSSVSGSISTYIDHKSRYEGRLGAFCCQNRNVFYLMRFFRSFSESNKLEGVIQGLFGHCRRCVEFSLGVYIHVH